MTAEGRTLLADRLRAACAAVWDGLHAHPFIRELAAGSLPIEKFRFYVEQNLQYLPEYARTMAVGVSKADDLETMGVFADDLVNVLENEIPENRILLQRTMELGAADLGGADGMAPANVGYTGFLVSTALEGGPAEIMAAIVPCTWSYGDIASALMREGVVHEHPVYSEWIRFFGQPEYGEVVARMRDDFERIAGEADASTVERLATIFRTSVRLERAFWDMAYGLEHWPDVRARYPFTG
jgi:thiaminase/transcriptional activator TenA